MNMRNFVSSPLATVLQNLCGRYLIVEADPDALALELRRKQVTLRNVLLNAAAFNAELAPFGFELRQGHVTQAELRVVDLATCRTSLELERVTIHLAVASGLAMKTETHEVNAEGGVLGFLPWGALWKSAAPIASTVWKWFTSNLRVTICHLTVLLETFRDGVVQLELENVQYQASNGTEKQNAETVPRLMADTAYLSLPDPSMASNERHRVLALRTVGLMLNLSGEQRIDSRMQVEVAELEFTSEMWQQLKRLLRAFGNEEDDFEDVRDGVSSIYYDAAESERSNSVYSDVSDSAFFDCEEMPLEKDMLQPRPIHFSVEVHQVDAMISETSGEGPLLKFLLYLKDVHCEGTYAEDTEIETSIGRMKLIDQSLCAEPLHRWMSNANIPQTLFSMIASHEDESSFWQFGFPQLQKKACLNVKITKEEHWYTGSVHSDPLIFWCSCDSIQRTLNLLDTFLHPKNCKERRTESNSPKFEFSWHLPGVYGVMERPRMNGGLPQALLFLEVKSVAGAPLVSHGRSYDSHQLYSPIPTELSVTSLSVAELGVYHCLCSRTTIVACHPVFACTTQTAHRSGSINPAVASSRALSIEIRSTAEQRHQNSDLSNLAYHLVHTTSQTDGQGFQERRLNRIGFEGKCIHSADVVIELTLESAKLDINTSDMEMCMDVLLQFWRPAKMADQMKFEESSQSVFIVKAENIFMKVEELNAQHPLELTLNDSEICLVSGVQRKTISTLAVSVRTFNTAYLRGNPLCSIGGGVGLDGPGIEFFQVSELDYRNAKFKQWSALRQEKTSIDVDRSVLSLIWVMDAVRDLLMKNKDRIETDIEVENMISYVAHDFRVAFKAVDEINSAGAGEILEGSLNQMSFAIQDLAKLTAEFCGIVLRIGPMDGATERFLHEEHLQCSLRPNGQESELEIRNRHCSIELDPDHLTHLTRAMLYLKSLYDGEDAAMDADSGEEMSHNLLQDIAPDAFIGKEDKASSHKRSHLSHLVTYEEDEDGFIMVEDQSLGEEKASMKASSACWLNDGLLTMRDDYIHYPTPCGLMDTSMLGTGHSSTFPPASWTLRCADLSLSCSLLGSDPSERIDLVAEGVDMCYVCFYPGSHYKNRWTASTQECRIVDHRGPGEGKCILERNRSQLRTECSKRLNHQQTMSSPMFRVTLETVLPAAEEMSKTTEMRVDLQVVPLRLRLSQSLSDFAHLFVQALPPSDGYSSGGVYFQKATVSALFVVVDYCPKKLDLDRLSRGRTSELINMVQWEGLEFFLNEIKVCGMSGWENLLSYTIHSWTYDITHSRRHHLLGGFPALGVLKRVSPAAQDVVRAAICKVTRTEPAEQDIRGVPVSQSLSLSRALGEFGRVFSLEILNLCANGAEGIHLVMEGSPTAPSSSEADSSLRQAHATLRRAAHSVITEPIQSVRSGEGLRAAMTKALWATPRALLAPASAALTVTRGALRSARDALDTDHVLDS